MNPLLNPLFETVFRDDGHKVRVSDTVSPQRTVEAVSDLTGIAIPSYLMHLYGLKSEIHELIRSPPGFDCE